MSTTPLSPDIAGRIQTLRKKLKDGKLDGMLIVDRFNTRYISGFAGTASQILILRESAHFITDARYTQRAQTGQSANFEVHESRQGAAAKLLRKLLRKSGAKKIAFEGEISFGQYHDYAEAFAGVKLVEQSAMLQKMRWLKDAYEIDAIRRACKITDAVFSRLVTELKAGISEREIYNRINFLGTDLGAEGPSFPAIIASGPNSSKPHYVPGDRRLEAGDFLTIDMGVSVRGYCSDMTRTVVIGKASDEQRRVYECVRKAEDCAFKALAVDKRGQEIDEEARRVLRTQNLEDRYPHGLGHGVGLEIHENPYMNKTCSTKLKAGMIITVEPGVYIPGWGGVRVEDTALLTENGPERLTESTRELVEIG
ncbi:aminopeptidase P family protein [Candidatus Sumerlaeota bacterium]|nr:aminopeptidase P family protein [Candidatus Sumerlaeota bacterium]